EDQARVDVVAQPDDPLVAELPLGIRYDGADAARPQPLILPDRADADADMRRYSKEPGESVEFVDGVGHDRIGSAIAGGADSGSASGHHPAAQRRRQSAERHRRRTVVLTAALFVEAPAAPLDAGAG